MKRRMLPLPSGKRLPLTLDDSTWSAIDILAGRTGRSWQAWCATAISKTPSPKNWTGAVREAVISELIQEEFMGDLNQRADDLKLLELHELMRSSAVLSDEVLKDVLSTAHVLGEQNFVAFTVFFGHDQQGVDCIWIQNNLRGTPNFAFMSPLGRGS